LIPKGSAQLPYQLTRESSDRQLQRRRATQYFQLLSREKRSLHPTNQIWLE